MTNWTAGYVADIDYTYGYYTELNPLRVHLAFINAGLRPPQIGAACELGFGQGVSANLHAAASVTRWHGTDFNPSQASFAQELSKASGADIALYDEAFDAFCIRDDLPEFDYVGLHGIWSWISDGNRALIVDFIRRKLKVGGVLYISYNTQPGWAAMVPMRDLLTEHAEVMGASGAGIINRIDGALAFADQLLAANPKFARANPQIKDRIEKIKEQNRHYVAHEYFNRDWQPMSFTKMAEWLRPAKVQWACSANYLDAVDGLNLSAHQQAVLKGIPDPIFRQTVRDFCVNQQFRKDYWVKGERKLSALERQEQLREQRIVLTLPRADIRLKVTGSLGEAKLQDAVFNPILDMLADHKVKTLGQLEQELKDSKDGASISFDQLLRAAIVLNSTNAVAAAQEDSTAEKLKKQTDKLNFHLMMKARAAGDLAVLASPVTGGGVNVPRSLQLFLLARENGKKEPKDWAKFVWEILAVQGQRQWKDGRALETAEEHLENLTIMAEEFSTKQLPILKALRIV